MTLFHTLRLGLLLALTSAAVTSCINAPDFPAAPSIEFKNLAVVRQSGGGTLPVDSVTVTIGFKDGDGDLGLNETEYTNPPYNAKNADGSINLNHYNYFATLFVKNPATNEFEPYTLTPDNVTIFPEAYYGQFPHLEPNPDKKAPLQGDLRFGQNFTIGSIFFPGQEVRFEISIKDRALNQSNTVTTSTYVVKP